MNFFNFLLTTVIFFTFFPMAANSMTLIPKEDRMILTLEWVVGADNPKELDIDWSFESSETSFGGTVATWFREGNRPVNFVLMVNTFTGALDFGMNDRPYKNPNRTGFNFTLPEVPVGWYTQGLTGANRIVDARVLFQTVMDDDGQEIFMFNQDLLGDTTLSGIYVPELGSRFQIVFSSNIVPEPGASVLMFIGLLGLIIGGKK